MNGLQLKFTIARKILLIGLVSITGLVSTSLLWNMELNKLYNQNKFEATNLVPSLTEIAVAKTAVIQLKLISKMSLDDNNDKHVVQEMLKSYESQANQSFDTYIKNHIADAQDRVLITRAQSDYIQFMRELKAIASANAQSGKSATDLKTGQSKQYKLKQADLVYALGDSVIKDLDAVSDYNYSIMESIQKDSIKAKNNVISFSTIVTSAVTFVVLCLVVLIKHSTIKQLGAEPEDVVAIVGKLLEGKRVDVFNANDNYSMLSKINRLVTYDSLTQLPNKIALYHQIEYLLGDSNRLITPFTFFKIEINGFKNLLDHVASQKVSDSLMHALVNRLLSVHADEAKLIKLDVDNLGVLLPNITDRKLIDQHLHSILQVFSQPFNVVKKSIILTCNIGIIFCPDDCSNKEDILEYANLALIKAKQLGQNKYQYYLPEYSQQHKAHANIEGELHHVLKNNELALYYQPQVDTSTEQIIGAEALIRWKHPSLGMIPPTQFIPIAEENGSIIEIGYWILLNAFKASVAWNQDRITPIKISINLSPRQLSQKDFISKLVNLMNLTGCKSEWIKLEVTESLLLDNSVETLETLISITELGIPISMDDFGTGYSSLSYLTSYPISQIKIDRSFMNDIPTHLDKCEVVKMIMRIAEIIHSDVVAEGVETLEQVEFLRSIKCDVVQGYFFYKPMSFDDFDQMVTKIKQHEQLKQEEEKSQVKKNKIVQLSRHKV